MMRSMGPALRDESSLGGLSLVRATRETSRVALKVPTVQSFKNDDFIPFFLAIWRRSYCNIQHMQAGRRQPAATGYLPSAHGSRQRAQGNKVSSSTEK